MPPVKPAFRPDIVHLAIARLTPLKVISAAMRNDKKYRQIETSMVHVGLIEPIVVFAAGRGKYLVLDGHKRLDILKARGEKEVRCLLATDDETYTYNKRVNYLSPIGEHYMILKALAAGVTEQRIADALDVKVKEIQRKRNLLEGICPEAIEILRDKRVNPNAFASLRRMKSSRQIEAAGLMVAADKFSMRFARALLAGMRADLRISSKQSQRRASPTDAAQHALLEQETDALLRDFKAVEESYGSDVLTLSVCCGYLNRLIGNPRVARYVMKKYPDILKEFQQLLTEVEAEKRRTPRMPVKKAVATKSRTDKQA